MQLRTTTLEDTFAEAFRVWGARIVITAIDAEWVRTAASVACGYATSVIGCDAEAGVEQLLDPVETPDGRPGAALLFFAFNAEKLAKAVPNRVGQCLMTCPTTAVYDGLPEIHKTDDSARLDLGNRLRFFGDGNQKSKVLAGRRYWRVPVMDGEFLVEDSFGAVKAIGGGNILICGRDQVTTLAAARRAVAAIDPLPGVITPFPGGVVRSGSKVGSRYKALFASTNDEYCPTMRGRSGRKTKLADGVGCVYEIVINGLNKEAIAGAMRAGIEAACGDNVTTISAGNYGGNLGKFHFKLHEIMQFTSPPAPGFAGGGFSSPNNPTAEPGAEGRDDSHHHAGYTLTWKSGTAHTIDGSLLRPDTLGKLDPVTLAATRIRVGRNDAPLKDIFDIAGSPGDTLVIRGAPALARLGAGMAAGELIIEGDAGDDLGASMKDGLIRVHGRAGDRAGGPGAASEKGMVGGEILIDGDAGDFVGLRMRRGLIAVRGRAGRSPGYRMLAGTIVLGRGPLDHAGLEMRRGTIVLLDSKAGGPDSPAFVRENTVAATAAPVLRLILLRLAALGWSVAAAAFNGRYALHSGDRFELGKGEVWQWLS